MAAGLADQSDDLPHLARVGGLGLLLLRCQCLRQWQRLLLGQPRLPPQRPMRQWHRRVARACLEA